MVFLNIKQIEEAVGYHSFYRGSMYKTRKLVSDLQVTDNGHKVEATVQGSRRQPYRVLITISHENEEPNIDGRCLCPMRHNCKHVAAALLQALEQKLFPAEAPAPVIQPYTLDLNQIVSTVGQSKSTPFQDWFQNFSETSPKKIKTEKTVNKPNQNLLYVLKVKQAVEPKLTVELIIARCVQKGGYGAAKAFSYSRDSHFDALQSIDHDLVHRLEVIHRQLNRDHYLFNKEFELIGENATDILMEMIKTGRCYWQDHRHQLPLQLGETKQGEFKWIMLETGEQKFVCCEQDSLLTVLPILPLWYVDLNRRMCGPLETHSLSNFSKSLLFAPTVFPEDIDALKTSLKQEPDLAAVPMPKSFVEQKINTIKPQPKLFLFGVKPLVYEPYDDVYPLGRVSFLYEKNTVEIRSPSTIYRYDENTRSLQKIARDISAETAFLNTLTMEGIPIFKNRYPRIANPSVHAYDFLIGKMNDKTSQEQFLYFMVPRLQKLGWIVEVSESFPAEYVTKVDDWYTEITESSEYDWFSMELGVIIEGEKVNILPLILKAIEQAPHKFSEKYLHSLKDELMSITLPSGQKVKIAPARISGMLAILTELYDSKSLDEKGQLKILKNRAIQLFDLEKAMDCEKMRWLGGEKLLKLSQQLKNFDGIRSVELPPTFIGKLREYQKQGVHWLNFLREYGLGGILSDDMGLGKTVQALVHLAIEKHEGRMHKPALIIAPTSLMENWRHESKHFTPSLKVLILQGDDRQNRFNEIERSDILLTTYPLLVRDQHTLLKHNYYMIILDEAQYIKNSNTKAYQILRQLTAEHRLCLTGTPMENHLGELWSLFNFLSPGFLGSSKQFTQIFRTPIERYGDPFRRQSLNQRIRPYLLRRTKEQVLKELPPKTEIIEKIHLEESQRDLYESIRLAMETKIQSVIQNKGLANSQIIILDALLKLRQVCCDPRLLKLTQAKKVETSAKLAFLMEMLVSLLEEGRKILLFSSFTSMLTLIEEELNKKKILYEKLTGSTLDRQTPIQRFQNGDTPLFLISLKAGGTGLNLTAADTVIHYDPWWNPAAERQASDRAHRIGQTKPVFVYKLVTAGTVEEKILLMQQKKKALLSSLFEETENVQSNRISAEDLQYLFHSIETIE